MSKDKPAMVFIAVDTATRDRLKEVSRETRISMGRLAKAAVNQTDFSEIERLFGDRRERRDED